MGQYAQAERNLREALEIPQPLGERRRRSVFLRDLGLAVGLEGRLPDAALASANPTHDNARVELDPAEASWVRVLVFDIRGRGVRELARRVMSAGRHTLEWDLRDDAGARVTQGVYFYQVWFGARKEARRLVVVR